MVAECSVNLNIILILYTYIRIINVDVSSLKIVNVRNLFAVNLRFYTSKAYPSIVNRFLKFMPLPKIDGTINVSIF